MHWVAVPKVAGSNPAWLADDIVGSERLEVGGEKRKLEDLSKAEVISLISKLSEIRKKRFKRLKEAKYGNVNRGFTDKELKTFLQCCSNEKVYLAFSLMALLGLRIGEVVKVRIEDVDLVKNKLRIFTEKAHTCDFLYLHTKVRKLLYAWVRKYQDEIVKNDGWILFSNKNYVSPNWLRREFRNACYLADLNESYGNANDENNEKILNRVMNRKLYRLTTHSLRHYYITYVYKNSRNPLHTQKLARHRNFKSTQVYIHVSQEDIDKTMKTVFEDEEVDANSNEIEDFMRFYKMWKTMKQ